MSRYSKKNQVSEKTKDDASKVARAIQKPGQTKEQTKLIAQGIQKGIEQYKKLQKEKQRELDKKLKKGGERSPSDVGDVDDISLAECSDKKLPWYLLALSWIGFVIYIYFTGFNNK